MHVELANLVHPVLAAGLSLRDRLQRGEEPAFAAEQAILLSLLRSDRDARRWPDFGGDDASPITATASEAMPATAFLGARYALACWLDDLFILDTPWSQRWNEHKIEMRLYASNDRAWKFWEQAKLATERPTADAIEAYFLCVMLGFTGERADDPTELAAWIAMARERIRRSQDTQWHPPPGLEPGTSVPPLRGRQALKRLLLVACCVLLGLVPILAVVMARRLS